MAQIAEASGVAVQTVYFAFHTTAALLSRAYDFAVMGEDEPVPPRSRGPAPARQSHSHRPRPGSRPVGTTSTLT